jgi:hypothetical protein
VRGEISPHTNNHSTWSPGRTRFLSLLQNQHEDFIAPESFHHRVWCIIIHHMLEELS